LKNTTKVLRYCKSCIKEIKLNPARYLLERKPLICDECISSIDTKLEFRKAFDVETLFLSSYSGIIKQWLMNFKELKDVELGPCFLNIFLPIIQTAFPHYLFIPLPSCKSRVMERGFDHLSLILESSHLRFLSALEKEEDSEQKKNSGPERFKAKRISLKNPNLDLSKEKVVLFDDVYTTGSTFKESLEAIKKAKPKKIKGLIIMDNFHVDELRMK